MYHFMFNCVMVYVDHLGHLYMTNSYLLHSTCCCLCVCVFWDITEKQLFLADVNFLSQKKTAGGCGGILLSVNMTSTNVSSSLPSHYSLPSPLPSLLSPLSLSPPLSPFPSLPLPSPLSFPLSPFPSLPSPSLPSPLSLSPPLSPFPPLPSPPPTR